MRQGGERSRQVPKRLRLTAWKSELAEINAKARQRRWVQKKQSRLLENYAT